MAAKRTAAQGDRHIKRWKALLLIFLAAGLAGAGVALFVIHATGTNLLGLQWAGSAANAARLVPAAAYGRYRQALYWDVWACTPGYGLGLITGCWAGARVFWRRRSKTIAYVGAAAAAVAMLSNWAQDALLLAALSQRPLRGTWVFQGATALSFVKFATVLVAIGIGSAAATTTLCRAALHRRTMKRWNAAAQGAGAPPPLWCGHGPKQDAGTQWKPAEFAFAPLVDALNERPGPGADGDGKADTDLSPSESWWKCQHPDGAAQPRAGRSGETDQSWILGSRYPFHIDRGQVGVCVSGGGIRAATVTLGALQSLREQPALSGRGASELARARYLVSVSGGGYTASAYQLAVRAAEARTPPGAVPPEVFAPGSAEEDHLRRHSSYISDTAGQWLTALGVLFRCVATGIALLGLTVTVFGLALGRFYRLVPVIGGYRPIPIIGGPLAGLRPLFLIHATIKRGKIEPPAPGWPPIAPGVILAVLAAVAATAVVYLAGLSLSSQYGKDARRTATAGKCLLGLTGLLVALGVAIPALIWLSSWLTWHIGFTKKTTITTGTLSGFLSYFGAVAATLWRKSSSLTKKGGGRTGGLAKKTTGQVLPSSMVQMLLLWLCLLVLILTALLASGWVATSGLDDSWWALVPVAVLLFSAISIDESWLSLQPFYRRRLDSAFAVPGADRGPHGAAHPQPAEGIQLSTGAARSGSHCFPEVRFAATANITGQDRTPPGRRAAPFMLASGYVGGPQTGWVYTRFLERLVHEPIRGDLEVSAARAISGAAFAAAMGAQTRFYEFFLALTNVRLGAWLPNPWFVARKSQNLENWTIPGLPSRRRLILLAREILGIHPSWSRLLFCTDGGHYDNLGLLELLRMRCALIYCFDASGGGAPLADTLAGTLAVAREELGVAITLGTPFSLVPGATNAPPFTAAGPLADLQHRLSDAAVIVGKITYPEPGTTGTLIFAQADLTRDMPYEILEYTQDDAGFPHDATADQWFNSGQFDAYHQLGRYLGQRAVDAARKTLAARSPMPPGPPGPPGAGVRKPPRRRPPGVPAGAIGQPRRESGN